MALDGIIEKARQFAESSRFNTVREPQTPTRLGIITSGVARDYLSDALAVGGWGDRMRGKRSSTLLRLLPSM